mgnify:CR=1 FL=1
MEKNLSKFISKKNLKTVGTVAEFLSVLENKGYKIIKTVGKSVGLGKKGVPQVTFENYEGRKVILRISQNLDARLTNNEEIDIKSLPIYDLGIDGIPELVIGLTGFEDFEPVPFDFSED